MVIGLLLFLTVSPSSKGNSLTRWKRKWTNEFVFFPSTQLLLLKMKCPLGSQSPPSFMWRKFHLAHIIMPIIFTYVKRGDRASLNAGNLGSSGAPRAHPGDIFRQCARVQVSAGRHLLSPILFRNRMYYTYKPIWNTFPKEYSSPGKLPEVRLVRLLPIHVTNNQILLSKKN